MGVAVLGALLYARKREKERQRIKKEAQRRHVPGQFKDLDKMGDQRTAADQY